MAEDWPAAPSPEGLLHLLEVARAGRVTAAAVRLGLDHTTVSRRISRLEKQVGQRLFDRDSSAGWTLTETGQRLRSHAEEIESSVLAAAEAVTGSGSTLSGSVRIVAPDGFGTYLLPPALATLNRRHPELTVEVVTADSHVSLTSRGFDVAVTLEVPPSRAMWSRMLTRYRLGLYASTEYAAELGPIADLAALPRDSLIYYVDDRLDIPPLRVLQKVVPGCSARLQFNNIAGQVNAVLAGVGIGLLPTYIGHSDPRLVRLFPEAVSVERCYWLVAPRELIHTARVRVIVELLAGLSDTARP